MVIEAFDHSLYATVEDSIFSLEEIPEVQAYSETLILFFLQNKKDLYI